ncbi:hypothetical protein BsWGS_10823 [Bradybaena similaris]
MLHVGHNTENMSALRRYSTRNVGDSFTQDTKCWRLIHSGHKMLETLHSGEEILETHSFKTRNFRTKNGGSFIQDKKCWRHSVRTRNVGDSFVWDKSWKSHSFRARNVGDSFIKDKKCWRFIH